MGLAGERHGVPRISDLAHVAPSSRGKLELTMSEDEGHEDKLIGRLVEEAVKNIFTQHLDVREFRAMVETAARYNGTIIDDIVPGHTGKGAD